MLEQEHDVLAGGGDMGERMRALDWDASPLGPVAAWPQALKTSVRIMLTSRQPMFVWWGDQLINLYNDAYRDILGGKHPWALGQPAEVVWREIWDQVGPRAQSAMLGNEGTYDEALLLIMERHGYPEETYYTFSYSPVPNDEGEAGGILCANTNDTARIIGERQLALLRALATETAEARTIAEACRRSGHALTSNALDLPFALIYLVDRDGQTARLAGRAGIDEGPLAPPTLSLGDSSVWPVGEVVRSNAVRLMDDLPAQLGALPAGTWDRPAQRVAVVPIAPSGATGQAGVLVAGLSPYRLFDADYGRFLDLVAGQIAAAIANAQAYEAERTRAESLAELDRAKTVFFSNVSHEFRTPLTLLLGPLEDVLAEEDTLGADERNRLEVAHRNALRLLRLVNTLLDFSRIEAGRVQATYEPIDLAAYTAELASTFRSAVERAGLRLVVDCPPLPSAHPVYVDSDMWEKILLNLLSNAFKFTLEGEIAVHLHPSTDGASVQLQVRDTGTGIPPEELPRLFERFHRVQGTRARTHEGTGIGLALVQELVRLHGGTVTVASVMGQGTTFTVTLPTGAAHLAPERISHAAGHLSTTGATPYVEEALRWLPDARNALDGDTIARDDVADLTAMGTGFSNAVRGRVLLADDNTDMREYVTRLLHPQFEVEAVPDGTAALEAARRRRPDLVLSDVMMPGLDGFALLRALRDDPTTRELPVILLSARAGEEARVEGLDAGADDYLVKPFAARELLARVGTHLALSRIRMETTQREQRARAEADLERNRLQHWLMQAPAAIALLRGPEHRFALANEAYRAVAGRDVMGKTIREAFPELAGQGIYDILDGVLHSGEPFVGNEVRIVLNRGEEKDAETYFNFVYQPIQDLQGGVEGIFVHAVDVTDQVRARRRLEAEIVERQRAEQLLAGERTVLELIARDVPLRQTLEALADFVEHAVPGGMCSVLLLDADGVHLRHGAAPSLPDAYNQAIDGVAIGPRVGSCGTAAYRAEAVVVHDIATDPLWVDFKELALSHGLRACWSTPIRDPDGGVLGTFAMYHREPHSPTETERGLIEILTSSAGIAIQRHRHEGERIDLLDRERTARAAAEAAVRARDEFLSIASHELRTPVTVVKGSVQMLQRSLDRDRFNLERLPRSLDTISRAADRLALLVNDLLDVSRIQSGQLTLRPEPIDLAALLRDVVERHSEANLGGHMLNLTVPPDEIPLEADPTRLDQVFDNLLSNAVKYSPSGGAIDVRLERARDGVTVSVRDRGIGLPEDAAERIFEPFGRATNAVTRNLPGMGLGLYVSRRIAEMHGGRLWAESNGEDEGTTLLLYLPANATQRESRQS